MYARLWWKDARQFWPVWVFLVIAAAASQWLALRYVGPEARLGALPLMALGWTCLYAFAVGAAAFAGEKESRTLAFLDTLPVARGVLWRGKVSFAIVSTLALGAVLLAITSLATDRWEAAGNSGVVFLVLAGVALLLEVVGWSLLCSALTTNALTAAVLAVCSALLFTPIILARLDEELTSFSRPMATPYLFVVAILTIAASSVQVMEVRPRGRRWRTLLEGMQSQPIARRPRRRRPRTVSTWRLGMWRLAWQSVREARPILGWLVGLGVALPVLLLMMGKGDDPMIWVSLNFLAGLVAGVSIFGVEHRAGTNRFLAHHGVRPGVVWLVKNAVWALGLALLWTPLAVLGVFRALESAHFKGDPMSLPLLSAAMLVSSVPIGLLCGMTIRRGITALVVAVVVAMALWMPQIALLSQGMMPFWIPVLTPLALLVVSWAWSGDWQIERPGSGRWVRLGLLITGSFGLVFALYVSERAWNVADLGRDAEMSLLGIPAQHPLAPGENAAVVYREAERNCMAQPEAAEGQEPSTEPLELIRRAASMPRCEFMRLDNLTLFSPYDMPNMSVLGKLVAGSARDRQERGDLAGSWDDLMVMFRMARHLNGPVPRGIANKGLLIERDALGQAMRWAADPKQTPDRIRAALDAFRKLPAMPPAVETIRAEAAIAEHTLQLPEDDLATGLFSLKFEQRPEQAALGHVMAALTTTPWEIARARRALRLLFTAKVWQATSEPFDRPLTTDWPDMIIPGQNRAPRVVPSDSLIRAQQSTPLVRLLFPNMEALIRLSDRNEVARRALVQILALRDYQLKHAGKLPDSLLELVTSGELDQLPADPYSGRHFGYVKSTGQDVLPLGDLEPFSNLQKAAELISTEGLWLLYSIGPDRRDNQATQIESVGNPTGDMIFPLAIPARPPEKKIKKDPGEQDRSDHPAGVR
jgi:hypothetical protein